MVVAVLIWIGLAAIVIAPIVQRRRMRKKREKLAHDLRHIQQEDGLPSAASIKSGELGTAAAHGIGFGGHGSGAPPR